MFYLVKAPWIFKKYYHKCTWEIPTDKKILYLTFDDGPDPAATTFVLDTLKDFDAKATFFCLGKMVQEHPDLYHQILEEGHAVGNHTYDHLNGWKVDDNTYIKNIDKASDLINSRLFRPPYGRITKFQLKALRGERFRMHAVMWSVVCGDFDERIDGDQCFINVTRHARPGHIIIFHDSEKAFPRLEKCLPGVLKYYAEKGFRFEKIRASLLKNNGLR